jgi:hypothetical protein
LKTLGAREAPARRRAGAAEHIRLALAAAGVEFDFVPVDRGQLANKQDLDKYKFGQVPR